jgi:hypothetical protein
VKKLMQKVSASKEKRCENFLLQKLVHSVEKLMQKFSASKSAFSKKIDAKSFCFKKFVQ